MTLSMSETSAVSKLLPSVVTVRSGTKFPCGSSVGNAAPMLGNFGDDDGNADANLPRTGAQPVSKITKVVGGNGRPLIKPSTIAKSSRT